MSEEVKARNTVEVGEGPQEALYIGRIYVLKETGAELSNKDFAALKRSAELAGEAAPEYSVEYAFKVLLPIQAIMDGATAENKAAALRGFVEREASVLGASMAGSTLEEITAEFAAFAAGGIWEKKVREKKEKVASPLVDEALSLLRNFHITKVQGVAVGTIPSMEQHKAALAWAKEQRKGNTGNWVKALEKAPKAIEQRQRAAEKAASDFE